MISKALHGIIKKQIEKLQHHANRIWYPFLISFLAALDNILIIIPTDGILISSSMLIPKRWFVFALSVAVGSTVGAIVLAALVELQGLPWILDFFPHIDSNPTWTMSMDFFEKYGLLLLFAVSVTPLMQQPVVIAASLANTPLFELAMVIFTGRLIKFLIMAYIGSHAPHFLSKLWGLKDDLKDAGVRIHSKDL